MNVFDGTWNVTIATPIGKQEIVLEIATRHGAVGGTARRGDEIVALVDPIAEGNRLRWTQSVTRPLRLTLAFDVTVDGDAMTGTAKAGVLPSSRLTGRRVT